MVAVWLQFGCSLVASWAEPSQPHELNNPLQSVTGLLGLLHEKLAKTEHSEYLRIIDSELRRVTTIVKPIHSLYLVLTDWGG